MRTALLVLTSIGLFCLLSIGGFKMLVKHIYNRTDCERFNIDNIEVRTGIDIPSVSKAECECDEVNHTKTSKFIINTEIVELGDYVVKNSFVLNDGIYLNSGEREDTKWKAVLDTKTNELTVTIEYRM